MTAMPNNAIGSKRNFPDASPGMLKTLSSKFEIRCHCLECGWSNVISPDLTQNQTLEEFKRDTLCPSCHSNNISISIQPK